MIQISFEFIPIGPSNNMSALIQVMAWCRTGNKPLPGPMMNQLCGAHMCFYWIDLIYIKLTIQTYADEPNIKDIGEVYGNYRFREEGQKLFTR